MRNSLADVVAAGLRVLDAQGLENCSMRRVAAELGVQPSALYHHVPDKQTLLALMADEIVGPVALGGGAAQGAEGAAGAQAAGPAADPRAFCVALREAMLAVRDGADVVASDVERWLTALVGADGARTLLLYTFGHAQSTQTHRQAAALGALIDPAALPRRDAAAVADPERDLDASFERGLAIILRGLDASATSGR
jgi:AcrR family transcriptional regulator